MLVLVKYVPILLVISIATGEITNSKGEQNRKKLNHISDQSDLLLAPRSNFGTFQLPNFVGFSYSRASIGGPKTRFINFRERVCKIFSFERIIFITVLQMKINSELLMKYNISSLLESQH